MTSEDNGNSTQSQSADSEGDSSRQSRWFPKNIKPAEWVMIVFTAVTAVAAWAGVWVSNGQLGAMLDSSTQTDRAIAETHRLADVAADANGVAVYARNTQKETADAALKAAKEDNAAILAKAREANKIAGEAITEIQRAFISVDVLGGSLGQIGNEPAVLFSPVIQNTGNTPATIAAYIAITPESEFSYFTELTKTDKYKFAAASIGAPYDPDDALRAPKAGPNPNIVSNLSLGPKGVIRPPEGEGGEVIGRAQAEGSQSGSYGRFFFGEIVYLDIFNGQHVTKYCFRIDKAKFVSGKYVPEEPSRCRHWNCTDGQCQADKAQYERELSNMRFPQGMK